MRGLISLGLVLLVAPLQAQQRTRSPHGDLKLECMTCHTSSGWAPVRVAKSFDHSKFGFALAGAHGTANCRACHQVLDFKGVKTDCASCHTDRHRGELGSNCARCHTQRSFLDREVMTKVHQLTRVPLGGGHRPPSARTGCSIPCSSASTRWAPYTSTWTGASGARTVPVRPSRGNPRGTE